MGRLGYARSAGGSGGRGKLRLNRAKDILSSKTPEPQVGVARVSPLSCGPVQGNWSEILLCSLVTFGCLENVYSGRHAHAQGQGQGAGAQSILLPSTIDNRFNASITTTLPQFGQFLTGNRFAEGKATKLSSAWAGCYEGYSRSLSCDPSL